MLSRMTTMRIVAHWPSAHSPLLRRALTISLTRNAPPSFVRPSPLITVLGVEIQYLYNMIFL